MSAPSNKQKSLKSLGKLRRRSVRITSSSLVEEGAIDPGQTLPWKIHATRPDVSLLSWAADHREHIRELVLRHGGVLFRGFKERGVEDFESLIGVVSDKLLEYKERSSPRSQVQGNVYTSTDYPPDQEIFLHNENSYQSGWPQKIFFFCLRSATEGGATPLADCRQVFQRLAPEIRQRFDDLGWMYVRNFGDGFGLSWQTVFQTEDRAVVEAHCRRNGVAIEWKDGGRLRTRAIRPTALRHPQSGELTWFNHATFFNISTLAPSIREALLGEFAIEDVPAHTYYGDGTAIESEVLDDLRQAYSQETTRFSWQEGDLLMLDNLTVAHGRDSFAGDRKVVVGMAEPGSWSELE